MNASCFIASPGTIQAIYYHQYLVNFSYIVIGGGTGYQAPLVSYVSSGQNLSSPANMQVWADAQSSYEYPSYLQGSSATERWIIQNPSMLSGTVYSASMQVVTYVHQYYITITTSTPQAGSVSSSTGWYNAGTVLSISAIPKQGWKFSSWIGSGLGSFSGSSQSSSIIASSPLTESAVFDVQLIIESSGWVKYSYGSISATANGNTTLYIPVGSAVSLTAYPSSPLYAFSGWHGASNSTSSSVTFVITQPSVIIASFSYNYLAISALVVAILIISILLFFLVKRTMK